GGRAGVVDLAGFPTRRSSDLVAGADGDDRAGGVVGQAGGVEGDRPLDAVAGGDRLRRGDVADRAGQVRAAGPVEALAADRAGDRLRVGVGDRAGVVDPAGRIGGAGGGPA